MRTPDPDTPPMADLVSAFEWAATPLGARADWPQSLKTAVDIVLGSGHAMQLAWGPDRTMIYNDAYAPMLGERHPAALGIPLRKAWPDVWDDIAPLVERVFAGETLRFQDMPLAMTRHGYPEETWWTFSYSPVRDETGAVAGLLNVTVDTTPRVRAEAERDESQRLQSAMLEVLPIGLALIGTDGGVILSNPEWDRFTPGGRLPSRDPDREWRWRTRDGAGRAVAPQDYPGSRALRGERCLPGMDLLYTDDTGRRIWTNVAAVPLFDSRGRVAGAVSIIMDIDDARRAQETLRHSEERQQFLLHLSDALRPLGEGGDIRRTAAAMLAQHLGASRVVYGERRAGAPGFDVTCHPGGGAPGEGEPAPDVLSGLQAGIPQVRPGIRPGPEPAQNGDPAQGGASLDVPLVKDGRLVAFLGVRHAAPHDFRPAEIALATEVAERTRAAVERARIQAALRDSEQRFRALVIAGAYTIYRVSPDWQVMYQIDSERIAAPPHPIRDWAEWYIPDEDRDAVAAAVDKAVRTRTMFDLEHRARQADGTVGWVHSRAVPLIGPDGAVGEWFGVASDVTERRTATERLRENEERQAFLLRLADATRPLADPAAIQDETSRLLGEHLGADRAYFVQIDEDRQVATVEREYRRGDGPGLAGRHGFARYGATLERLRTGRAVVFDDVETDPAVAPADLPSYRALGLRAFLNTPLVKNGVLVCAMCVASARPHHWTPAEIALVEDVAERTWAAVERARAEAALHASEERFRGFGENSSEVLWIVDTDRMQLDYLSPAFERIWGESRAAVMADLSRWQDRIHPEDRARAGEAMPHLLAGEAMVTEYRILRPDGQVRWIRDTGFPIRDQGVVRRGGGIAQDVTHLKRAEAALRESEERLRQFGEASQDVLWIRDAETLQWQYLTPAFEAIYGLTRDEALAGNNYRSWVDLIVPADRGHATDAIRRVRAGEHVTFDYRIRRPRDGMIRWLRNTDFPIADDGGRVALIGGIGHDLTELRETELRLQTLVEGIPQLVWRATGGGQWTWASPQWTGFTGQADADSHGWGWLDAVHPDDRAAARDAWARAGASGGFQAEHRLRHAAGGDYRWFQTRATPVRDDSGRIIEWLGTSTDIHDLRALQDRQRILVAELQHRTRNLMSVIRAIADRTGEASRDVADFRDRFQERLDALARVQGLLSRLGDTGRVTFDDLIRTQLEAMDAAARNVDIDGPPGIRLRSSMVQTLAMALHELATNAVKYGALGQPQARLAIRWRLEPPDPRGRPWLHIDWHESGVRIPPPGTAPQGTGQGRDLIERALPYQLGARTSFTVGPDGVRCTIAIPVSASNARAEGRG